MRVASTPRRTRRGCCLCSRVAGWRQRESIRVLEMWASKVRMRREATHIARSYFQPPSGHLPLWRCRLRSLLRCAALSHPPSSLPALRLPRRTRPSVLHPLVHRCAPSTSFCRRHRTPIMPIVGFTSSPHRGRCSPTRSALLAPLFCLLTDRASFLFAFDVGSVPFS